MPSSLLAAAMGLAEMLTRYDQYLVPDYQRVYGWGEVEVSRLFADVDRAMQPNAPRFFLGPFYLAVAPGETRAQIADGQQRLLTATMIYAVARDLSADAEGAARLGKIVSAPGEASFRFVPGERDAAFFRKWVQEPGATRIPFLPAEAGDSDDPESALSESQRNIISNRDSISGQLQAMGEDGRNRLLAFLENDVNVVMIVAPTLEEARNAYASTQTRGLRQAETDKLKAELIGDCPPDIRARLAIQWEDCEAKLGKEDLTELLQHMIMVQAAKKPSHALEVDLFPAFNLPQDVARFIGSELLPSARAFRRMGDAKPAGFAATRRIGGHLTTLRRMTHETWKAPALLGLRMYEHEPAALEAFLRGLERLAASLMIRGTDPNHALERYVDVIKATRAGPDKALAAMDLSQKERNDTRKGIGDSRFGIRDRFRMPLLLKLNDLVAREVQEINPKLVSCEHVLPRNTSKDSPWRDLFRTSDGSKFDGPRYVNMLGNLTLLTHEDNQAADRHPYTFKRAIFRRSEFALANEAARAKAWTPDTVRARSDRLAKLLIDHWQF